MRLFCCVWIGTSFLKCKGIREYVRIPSYLPLAQGVVAFLTCGALYNVAFVFNCSPGFSSRRLTSGAVAFVFTVACPFKVCFVHTPASEGVDVAVLLFPTTAVWGLRIFAIGRMAVVFDISVDCLVCSSSGVRSICAGLTRSAVTVSTLPLINTLNTRPLLATTLYGPS